MQDDARHREESAPPDAREGRLRALEALRAALPDAVRALGGGDMVEWRAAVDQRLLPRLRGELPLLVGLCGGGNAGKSTLFNLLAGGGPLSTAGATAGLTRRALLGVPSSTLCRPEGLQPLVAPLGDFPEPLRGPEELLEPGPARYVPAALVLIDTPDFNVGDVHGYANRGQAQSILAACDLLVYVATNQLYSNRDALDFMRETLTAVGSRPCVLVYRFDDPGDATHLNDVFDRLARGLYGDAPAPVLMRVVVADDRAAVRDGREPAVDLVAWDAGGQLRRESCGIAGLRARLIALDRTRLRAEDTRRTLTAVRTQAEAAGAALMDRKKEIETFLLALDIRTERAAVEAVQRFPLGAFQKQVVRAYHAEESPLERLARHVGRIPSWLRRVLRTDAEGAVADDAFAAQNGALAEAQALHAELANGRLHVRFDPASPWGRDLVEALGARPPAGGGEQTASIAVPESLRPEQERLLALDWAGVVAPAVEAAALQETELDGVQEALRSAVRRAKQDRSHWEKLKHGFLMGAQIATPFAALAYVVGTGGAVLGLLGAKDLGAVVALPVWLQADAELAAVVRQLMDAVIGQWHARKRERIARVLRTQVAGAFIAAAEALRERSAVAVEQVSSALAALREADR
jgi:hypothetical protein